MADQHSEIGKIPEDFFLKLLLDAAKGPAFSAAFASIQPNVGASSAYGGATQSSDAGQVSSLPLPDYFAELPLEVLLDILKRLPLKSIGMSRCVTKQWLALLTNYEFIKAHFAQEQKILLGSWSSGLFSLSLHQTHGSNLKELKLHGGGEILLMGACNGLVLVQTSGGVMWVINCMIQEFVKVHVSPFPLCPHHSVSKYGLGYDELTDDYKIVKISQCDFTAMGHCPDAEIFVDIYSLKMKSWRRLAIGNPLCDHDFLDPDCCVFINGAFHWIGLKFKYAPEESPIIGCFDLSHEKFKEFPAPASLNDDSIFLSARLMVIDGCLGISVCLPPRKTEIWLMRSYSLVESWTKIVVDFRPLCCGQDRILFHEERDRVLKWYCVKDESVEVCLVVDDGGLRKLSDGIAYTESLVSPHFNYHNRKLAAIGRI